MEEKINYIIGMHPVIEAVKSGKKIEKVLFKSGLTGELFGELLTMLKERNISFQFVPMQRLNKISKGSHQGVIAQISAIDFISLETAIEESLSKNKAPLFVLLDGVSDVRNLGAIARSAECAMADAIIVPSKGVAAITPDAVKASAGALMRLNISKVSNLKEADTLIYDVDFRGATAIIMGSEGKGISPAVLSLGDVKCKIPMLGQIGSLNVSVATSIILFEAVRQRMLS